MSAAHPLPPPHSFPSPCGQVGVGAVPALRAAETARACTAHTSKSSEILSPQAPGCPWACEVSSRAVVLSSAPQVCPGPHFPRKATALPAPAPASQVCGRWHRCPSWSQAAKTLSPLPTLREEHCPHLSQVVPSL